MYVRQMSAMPKCACGISTAFFFGTSRVSGMPRRCNNFGSFHINKAASSPLIYADTQTISARVCKHSQAGTYTHIVLSSKLGCLLREAGPLGWSADTQATPVEPGKNMAQGRPASMSTTPVPIARPRMMKGIRSPKMPIMASGSCSPAVVS